jgi:hypothetical protein
MTSLFDTTILCLTQNEPVRETEFRFKNRAQLEADPGPLLSRQKRDFGGKEPIDWPKTYNAVFGVTGWLAQACEAFSDINFHLLGYNALGSCHPGSQRIKETK